MKYMRLDLSISFVGLLNRGVHACMSRSCGDVRCFTRAHIRYRCSHISNRNNNYVNICGKMKWRLNGVVWLIEQCEALVSGCYCVLLLSIIVDYFHLIHLLLQFLRWLGFFMKTLHNWVHRKWIWLSEWA